MIPEGWAAKAVGEICELVNGRGFKPHEWKESGLPIIRIQNLNGNADFNYYDGTYDTKIEVESGQLLFAWSGSRGTSFGAHIWRGPKAVLNYHTWKIVAADGYSSEFLHYLFQHLTRRIESSAHGAAALVHTQKREMENFPVVVPPYSEQVRIAERMAVWDRAIEAVEALIANARAQKQALMQQLLGGKYRLPGFSGEWQRKPINEIATRITRRNDGTDLPVLTISSTSGFVRQDEKYSRFMAGKSVDTYIVLNEGEFAYNKGNSKTYEFGCIFDLEGYARALVPHVYVCFKLKKGYSHRFYKALFEADYLAPQLGQLVNTGVRNNGLLNIKPSEFLGTKVPVPPLEEQDAIAAVMEAASRTVIEHEAQLTALRQEKAALMQQLLTGKRRVKLPESEVA